MSEQSLREACGLGNSPIKPADECIKEARIALKEYCGKCGCVDTNDTLAAYTVMAMLMARDVARNVSTGVAISMLQCQIDELLSSRNCAVAPPSGGLQ